MKKSVIALLAASAIAAICLPALSGCSAQVDYILKTDADGNHYYAVKAGGFTSSLNGEVVIPAYYGEGENEYPVKEIEAQAFSYTSISKVIIPATVEKIGNAAFAYNSYLNEVVFEGETSVDAISWGMFAYCLNLKSFTVPASVRTVDGMAFYGCNGLEQIEFSAGLERINENAFNGCVSLVGVEFPEGLISIGTMAFYGCESIESIVLPDGMHDTEETKVNAEGQSETVTVPAVGAIAFYNCKGLKLAVLGEGITAVEGGLFGNCTNLDTLYLPSTLKEVKGIYSDSKVVYGHPFYNVTSLDKVYFAGTEAQWAEVVIDESSEKSGNEVTDNSAILNAAVECNIKYGK